MSYCVDIRLDDFANAAVSGKGRIRKISTSEHAFSE